MTATAIGNHKISAARLGLSLEDWLAKRVSGEKWCSACQQWHLLVAFGRSVSEPDRLARTCRASRSTGNPRGWHGKPSINPKTGRPGRTPKPPRDGDRIQARQLVARLVKLGDLPNPRALPCADCGAHWRAGNQRHEYDHHLGYAAEHHREVQPVCGTCHKRREKARRTHCRNGHEYTKDNTRDTPQGWRRCLRCEKDKHARAKSGDVNQYRGA